MYLLILLFPIILWKGIPSSKPLALSVIFGITYTFPLIFHNPPPTASSLLFYFIYPTLFYLLPIYLSRRFKNQNSLFLVLIMVVTCISSWSIVMNIKDTVLTGQIVNLHRVLDETIKDDGGALGATNHNMMLALAIGGIGMIVIPTKTKLMFKEKVFLFILSLAALFAAFHLLNRTAVVLAVASIFVALISKGISIKSIIKYGIIVVTLILILSMIFEKLEWITEIIAGFESREGPSTHGMETAGGRSIRWMAAIQQIPFHPFGADALFLNGKPTFAHNTWLDCGIQSGWIAFCIFLLITYSFLMTTLKVFKLKRIPIFQRSYFIILAVILILQLMVEPVIQGVYLLFLMMFFLWSMFDVYLQNPNIRLNE